MTCDSCGKGSSDSIVHDPSNCIKEYTKDHTCFCPVNQSAINLTKLDFHGRSLELCDQCFSKETSLLKASEINLHEYQKNLPDKIETRVANEIKSTNTVSRWQEIFIAERKHWVIENFNSIDEMKDELCAFILSLEQLEFEIKAKKRAAFEGGKELDARLSKAERAALIADPSFKPASNSEYKKLVKEREAESITKGLDIVGATKAQMKAAEGLAKMGFSAEDIKKIIKEQGKVKSS